ncbi:endothelial cell-specific molecule 1 isoform X2 [Erinaceus europaeus]|uniref:Endothelial cell-specific molecule 1 n=1 Tax=Erinaceus europaeus TaxID=9365 RepID=A0A1S2ZGC0_ERIEU|nr:endothelial cell-specific molecule 1 isoform X2 [Erinaceus europaeus]
MTERHAGNPVYKTHQRVGRGSATTLDSCFPPAKSTLQEAEPEPEPAGNMKNLLLLATLLVPVHLAAAWSSKYAVDCPEHCDSSECKINQRCKKTVLDDCGCCRVCAAEQGEICYRTVSAMDGVKCGPGLRCQLYNEEDAFGDEFGVCKEHDMASGDGSAVRELVKNSAAPRSPVMKWLHPR